MNTSEDGKDEFIIFHHREHLLVVWKWFGKRSSKVMVGGTNGALEYPWNQLDEVMKPFDTPAGIGGEYVFCQLRPKSQSTRFVAVTHNPAFQIDTSSSLQAVPAVYFHGAAWEKPQCFGA